MAEKPQDTKVQNGGGVGPEATESRQAHETAETARRGERSSAQGARRSGEAMTAAMRRGEDAETDTPSRHGSVAGGPIPHRDAAAAEGRRDSEYGGQQDDSTDRMTPAFQDSGRDLRTLFALASAGRDGMQDVRDSISSMVEGVLRTNMRMVQELFRMSGPVTTIELQHRVGVAYLDTLLDSTTMLLRATCRAAEGALRPLEERRRETGHPEGGALHGCVADVMETEVRLASPDDTVQRAAQLMRDTDAGSLPVGEGDRLVGTVTGRDVAVRLVAESRDPRQTRVREVMTPAIHCVFEDEDLGHAARNMAEHQMPHLPVISRDRRVVGMVSLADLTRNGGTPATAQAAV